MSQQEFFASRTGNPFFSEKMKVSARRPHMDTFTMRDLPLIFNLREYIRRSDLTFKLKYFDEHIPQATRNPFGGNHNRDRFNSPESITSDEIPKELQELDQIQQTFLHFNSDDETQLNKLLDFIDKNPNLGLRELEICLNIRPTLIKHYVKLYLKLQKSTRLLAQRIISFTSIFRYVATSFDPSCFYEVNTTGTTLYNYLEYPSIIFGYEKIQYLKPEIIENLLNDDIDFFTKLASETGYNTYFSFDNRSFHLIDLFALYGSVNCFKTFILNNINIENTPPFAIAGGNPEIIRILAQKNVNFANCMIVSLIYRQDEMYNWLYENYNHDMLLHPLLSDTMSVRAYHALSRANPLSNFIDLISAAYIDGQIEMCKYLSKYSYFSDYLFFMTKNEEIVKNFMYSATGELLNRLFRFAIYHDEPWYIKFLLLNDTNRYIQLTDRFNTILKENYPEIMKALDEVLNVPLDPAVAYYHFLHGYNIAKQNVYPLIQHCFEKNEEKAVAVVQEYYEALTFEQVKEICKRYPPIIDVIYQGYKTCAVNDDLFLLFIRYFYKMDGKQIAAKLVTESKEFLDQLNPFDCLNICQLYQYAPKQIQHILFSKKLISQLFTNSSSFYDSAIADKLEAEVIKSDVFIQYFNEHNDDFVSYLYKSKRFIFLYRNVRMTKETFNKLLRLYKSQNCKKDFVDCMTTPLNRHLVDIKELYATRSNYSFIINLDLTKEEFDFLYSKDPIAFKDYLYKNPQNAKYMTAMDLLNLPDFKILNLALDYAIVTDEFINFLNGNHPRKHLYKHIISSKIILNEKVLTKVKTSILMDAALEQKSDKIYSEIFKRQLEPTEIIEFYKRHTNDAAKLAPYVSLFPPNLQAIYSIRMKKMFVPKGTKIDSDTFEQMIKISSIPNIVANFTVSKADLTKQLFNTYLSFASIYELVKSGAYINAVINGITPLLMLQYKVELITKLGADHKFRIDTYHHSQLSHNFKKNTIPELLDLEYEIHYHPFDNLDFVTFDVRIDLFLVLAQMFSKFITIECADINEKLASCQSMHTAVFNILLITNRFDHLFTPFGFKVRGYKTRMNQESYDFLLNNFRNYNVYVNNAFCVLASINEIYETPDNTDLLYLATRIGNIQIIRSLLEKGALIHEVEGYYFMNSPALEAVAKYRPDVLQLFIEFGLDCNQIYSAEDFTLINACILYNSVECFMLIIDRVSLEHYVPCSPMDVALYQYSCGNKYFVELLYDRIDKELERIENPSFVDFEWSIQTGQPFNFNMASITSKVRGFSFSALTKMKYSRGFNISNCFDGHYVVQYNLRANISTDRFTPKTRRKFDFKFDFNIPIISLIDELYAYAYDIDDSSDDDYYDFDDDDYYDDDDY